MGTRGRRKGKASETSTIIKDESKADLNYAISLMDVVVLLYHIHKGAQHSEVGFEDADRTLKQLSTLLMKRRLTIPRSVLESALWSCNLLDEVEEFWHPSDLTFSTWVDFMLRPYSAEFDKFYNWISNHGKE